MKNRTTVKHGTLSDLKAYLVRSGWTLEPPVGAYEVLRARRPGYPRPLLVHTRSSGGCGYSIDERLEALVAEMKEIGQRPAPSRGGYYNNLLDYNATRERILCLCLAAMESGYRFKKEG